MLNYIQVLEKLNSYEEILGSGRSGTSRSRWGDDCRGLSEGGSPEVKVDFIRRAS